MFKHHLAQRTEHAALTADDSDRLWGGGDIRGVPIRCSYCDQPAAWAVVNGPYLDLACASAEHLARAGSVGSAVSPAEVAWLARRLASDDRPLTLSEYEAWQFGG